jgi:hypothetical protein
MSAVFECNEKTIAFVELWHGPSNVNKEEYKISELPLKFHAETRWLRIPKDKNEVSRIPGFMNFDCLICDELSYSMRV